MTTALSTINATVSASGQGFDQFEFPSRLLQRLQELGHEAPSRLQQDCIPALAAGRDLMALAETGTGKTMAFVLPLVQRMDSLSARTQVLVLTPTDEVALHVAEVFQSLANHLSEFHVLPIYHQSATVQLRQLQRGAQVVVGTPRRLLHHIEDKTLSFDALRTVVLDELDRMLREGFAEDIEEILKQARAKPQMVVFAAGMSREILLFSREHLVQPLVVGSVCHSVASPPVRQRHWLVRAQSKLNTLTRLVELERNFESALVFVHTRTFAAQLSEKLKARGYACAALDGETPAESRAVIAEQFLNGVIDLVVCTDLAVDGLHFNRLSHVISYDLPLDAAGYLHRIGHLARSQFRGSSVLLVTAREQAMLHGLEHAVGQRIPHIELPDRVR